MQLHFRRYGEPGSSKIPVILLHGLLGSSINWHGIAGRIEQAGHCVLVPDLRNHGRSPHHEIIDYPSMAADVIELQQSLGFEQAAVVGHSMGAKAAMWMALNNPECVAKLVSVDMIPGRSPRGFKRIFDALTALDLEQLDSRKEAERILAKAIDNSAVRLYLLQNLVHQDEGWQWRMNLPVLASTYDVITDFPELESGLQYQGEALFIYGGESDYVTADSGADINKLFPFSRLRAIPGAGHWVYAERPDEFFSSLIRFLN